MTPRATRTLQAMLLVALLASGSGAFLGLVRLSWQPSYGCTRTVEPAASGNVIVEDFCRYWNSSAGECTRREHPVWFGLFLGRAEGPYLTCG